MKKFERQPRPNDAESSRTGPRARAAQERKFNDPYSRAERPAPPSAAGRFDRSDRGPDRRETGRPSVITLDPDVARVFRNSEAVNEALRMVIRLARLAGPSRPPFNRDRPGAGSGAPRGRAASGAPRGAPRADRTQERRGPPRGRPTPRFKDE